MKTEGVGGKSNFRLWAAKSIKPKCYDDLKKKNLDVNEKYSETFF